MRHPTKKQLDAYRLVYIHGCTHAEAGAMLGIGRSSLTERLSRLKKLLSGGRGYSYEKWKGVLPDM